MIRLVLIDDDAMVRTGLKLLLGGEPELEIIGEAVDGEQGLEVIGQVRPDVVLLDIRMPGLDGLGMLERLVGDEAAPPVIVLTTFNTDDYVLRALQLGARGFLLKDADPNEMVTAIRNAHAGQPVLSPEVTRTVIEAATGRARIDPQVGAAVAGLTDREREVAVALAGGATNAEIAAQLFISVATVKATISRIFVSLDVDNRVSAAMIIRDAGLLED